MISSSREGVQERERERGIKQMFGCDRRFGFTPMLLTFGCSFYFYFNDSADYDCPSIFLVSIACLVKKNRRTVDFL